MTFSTIPGEVSKCDKGERFDMDHIVYSQNHGQFESDITHATLNQIVESHIRIPG